MRANKTIFSIFLICQLAILGLSSQPLFAAPVVESRIPLLHNAWSVYAPAQVRTREGRELLAFGGWLTQADEGNDVIYIADAPNGDTAIDVASAPLKRFVKPEASINDPSLVVHPEHGWLMMYYTNLDEKQAASFEAMTSHNHIGFATSSDDGATWTERAILIGQNNGYNTHGAWAPSALLNPEKNQIWLYYHTNSPSNIVLRTRVGLNGWESQGPTEPVVFYERDGQRSPLQNGRLNVDVKWNPDLQRYMMVVNEFTLHNVVLYTSIDGINFYRESDLIQGGANATYTPEITPLGPTTFEVAFGFGQPTNACSQSWAARNRPNICADSIHVWRFQDVGLLEALPAPAALLSNATTPAAAAIGVVTTKADAAPQEPEFQQSPVFAALQKSDASAVAEQPPTALPAENAPVTPEAPQAPQSQPQTVPAQKNLVFGGPQEPVEPKVADTLAAANLNQAQALPAGSNVLQVPSMYKANGHGVINPPKTSFKTTTAGATTINEGVSECPTDAWICDLYQHYLGRMPTPAEVSVQQSQQRSFAELEEIIKSSEEAKAKQTQIY